MAGKKGEIVVQGLCVGVGIALCATFPLRADESIRITVHAGARHAVCGMGASSPHHNPAEAEAYANLSEATRKEIAAFFWKDADFRVMRLWSGGTLLPHGLIVKEALEVQPGLLLIAGPTGQGMSAVASEVKAFEDANGVKIEASGVCNEPNVNGLMSPGAMPGAVKSLRQELDSRGLQHVKVVAPEVSHVDDPGINYVQQIINDPAALDALGGFGTHSYNMAMTKELMDLEAPHGKENWITEASGNGAGRLAPACFWRR